MIVGLTLGQCVIEIDGERVTPESEVVFGTLLYLTTQAGRAIPRRTMMELLWPGTDEARARHCLRQTLYRIRRMGARIDGDGEIRVPASIVSLDHQRIAECPAVLLEPTPMVLGAYLPGYAPLFSPPFAEWIEEQRAVVHSRVCRAIMAAVAELRIQGRFGDVEALAGVCLELDPLNEEATLALAESAAMSGSRAHALGILDRYVEEVGGELRLPATLLRRRIAERLPLPRYGASLEPAFVGRAAPLAELTALWNDAHQGEARMGLVWGDSGIGKTRLAAELTTLAIVQGARAERLSSQPVDAKRPLSIFVDLVPRLLAMRGAAGVSPESMAHLRRLTEVDTTPAPRDEDAPDAAYRHAELRRAIFDLLGAVTAEGALVLVLEDAHWLDAVSWQLLAEIRRRCATQRLLVVLTSRVAPSALSHADALAAAAACVTIHLHPLTDDAARELVESSAQRRAGRLSPEASALCVRRGAGNPFFLQELVVHVLSGRGMATLPLTVQTLLEERLASVRPRAAQVLQTIALLGKAASIDRLEAVLEYKTHELVEALEELEAAGLLAVDGQGLACRHELLGIEAVARLSPASRLVLHRRTARVLEREIEASRSATWLWECASHWAHTGDGGRVVRLAVLCGEQLVEMGLPGDAASLFRRTLQYCQSESDRCNITSRQIEALAAQGDWPALRDTAEQAVNSLNSQSVHSDWEIRLLEAKWRTLSPSDTLLAQTLRCVESTDATLEHRKRAAVLGMVLADAACAEEAVVAIGTAIAGAQLALSNETDAMLQIVLHASYGDLELALEASARAIALVRAGLASSPPRVLRWASVAFTRIGRIAEALSILHEAFEYAERSNLWTQVCPTAEALAYNSLARDDISSGEKWCNVAMDWATRSVTPDPFVDASLNVLQARLALHGGDAANALRLCTSVKHGFAEQPPVRARFRLLAIEAGALRALQATPELVESVNTLRRLYTACAARGGHDFEVFQYVAALQHCGDLALARDTWARYTRNARRDRSSIPASCIPTFLE